MPIQRRNSTRHAFVAILAILAGAFAADADPAAASDYNVAQCSPGHRGSVARVEGSVPGFETSTGCGSGGWLRVTSVGSTPPRAGEYWVYRAPAGTVFERIQASYSLVGGSPARGNRSVFFIGRTGVAGNSILSSVEGGSTAGIFDSLIGYAGWTFKSFGVGMSCSKTTYSCGHSMSHQARVGGVALRLRDVSPPSKPALSGPATSDWLSGGSSLSVDARDTGAGLTRLDMRVNGTPYRSKWVCNSGVDTAGYVTSMTPCPGRVRHDFAIDVSGAPFREGTANTIRVCSIEYGSGPAYACATTKVKVDNVAPQPPTHVELDGKQGWRRDNGFDVSWANASQSHAPIAGGGVRIDGPGGTETFNRFGANLAKMENVKVPSPGSYSTSAKVFDAAGNWSASSASEAELKFDDTVPPGADLAKANGWLSRNEVVAGYEQFWVIPDLDMVSPSGIAGYRVVIDQEPNTDPCAGGNDPRTCAGAMTEYGLKGNSRVLTTNDVAEGKNYVHVVPVSGSGMRARGVNHTRLDVDLTAPEVSVSGAHTRWRSTAVDLVAHAKDGLSGMGAAGKGATGEPASTFVNLGGKVREQAGVRASVRVAREGVHRVQYWARDLAGNVSGKRAVTVRIDRTAPTVAFATSQDPRDPDRIVAPVGDGLSGVASGAISFRPRGGSWRSLDTAVKGGALVARVRSESMKPGVTYEFTATAVDRAGNRASTGKRQDGKPMRSVGPFKRRTAFENVELNGRTSRRVSLRKRVTVRGRLRAPGGAGIAGARVLITETYEKGSRRGRRETIVRSDVDGKFEARLRRGPSRRVTARFEGSRSALPSESERVKLKVRSRTSLKVRRKARAGGKVRFRGRVKAPGARFSRVGKRVEVQVRVGKRWKAVGRSIRTNRRGKFRLSYRFVARYTSPVRFTFRAVALRENGFPYLPSKSRKRKVVVRP